MSLDITTVTPSGASSATFLLLSVDGLGVTTTSPGRSAGHTSRHGRQEDVMR